MIGTKELSWAQASCATGDARLLHLFFSEDADEIEEAKALCRGCPMRLDCLTGAVERQEPWGVWGGHLFDKGQVLAGKRSRGRPRKDEVERQADLERAIRAEVGLEVDADVA